MIRRRRRLPRRRGPSQHGVDRGDVEHAPDRHLLDRLAQRPFAGDAGDVDDRARWAGAGDAFVDPCFAVGREGRVAAVDAADLPPRFDRGDDVDRRRWALPEPEQGGSRAMGDDAPLAAGEHRSHQLGVPTLRGMADPERAPEQRVQPPLRDRPVYRTGAEPDRSQLRARHDPVLPPRQRPDRPPPLRPTPRSAVPLPRHTELMHSGPRTLPHPPAPLFLCAAIRRKGTAEIGPSVPRDSTGSSQGERAGLRLGPAGPRVRRTRLSKEARSAPTRSAVATAKPSARLTPRARQRAALRARAASGA
jgi:hypothetical protein